MVLKYYIGIINKNITFLFILLALSIFVFIKCASDATFDKEYWKSTNMFYMVFDMTKNMDTSEKLSFFEMIKISRRRTRIANELVKNNSLIGSSKEEMVEMLGEGSTGFVIGGDYNNSMQYVIDADARGLQFYGESGIRWKYFMVFFNDSNRVAAVHIANRHGKFE
jgi:hypothetical protein